MAIFKSPDCFWRYLWPVSSQYKVLYSIYRVYTIGLLNKGLYIQAVMIRALNSFKNYYSGSSLQLSLKVKVRMANFTHS